MTRSGVVFAVCLLLAFSLLFLNKLSRKYIGEISAKIQYVHLPAGKVPTSPLPDKLKLYVETTGFKLLWSRMLKPAGVQINLSALKSNYIVTSALQSEIASQLSAGYRLIEITPDTLFFNFSRGNKKKVPVVADILISFKKQYDFMEPMLVKPDSVTVSGPESIVAGIQSWKTEKLVFENLDKSLQNEAALVAPSNPAVVIEPKKVRYTISVERYTEKTLEAEIEKANVPDGKTVNIYPNKVKLIFRVGLSNYEHVGTETFKAVADFAGVDLKRGKYVSVEIKRAPSYIRNLDYSPKSVEYIIIE
ncbi:MAG TPA: YbbR-like domain-containing protein [Chitinophagales bacterium]|nr:YbbR-like domain-containing protein [Chitinophagales bacterium]